MSYRFTKEEKLTNSKLIDALFQQGRSLKQFPFVLTYLPQTLPVQVERQVLIIAPKRNMKLAVTRNKVKRQMRELYRLQRHHIDPSEQQEVWAIRYLGNRINNYAFLEKAFLELIQKYNEQKQQVP